MYVLAMKEKTLCPQKPIGDNPAPALQRYPIAMIKHIFIKDSVAYWVAS